MWKEILFILYLLCALAIIFLLSVDNLEAFPVIKPEPTVEKIYCGSCKKGIR